MVFSDDTYGRNTYVHYCAQRELFNILINKSQQKIQKVELLSSLSPHEFILLEFRLSAGAAAQPELQLADSAVPHRLLIGRQLLRKLNLHRGFHTSQPADHSGSSKKGLTMKN